MYISTAYGKDAQAYCAKVGDDDTVKTAPVRLIMQARKLFDLSPDIDDAFVRNETTFRCMGGRVWLCFLGANLACGKANISRESAGATAFCKENPGSDFVPLVYVGHDTIYSWECAGYKARISGQIYKVDPRGFIAENWKRLK